jgi:hypothetical protein
VQSSSRFPRSRVFPYLAYGVDAEREVADPYDRIWRCLAFLLCLSTLQWSEPYVRQQGDAEISINKAAFF